MTDEGIASSLTHITVSQQCSSQPITSHGTKKSTSNSAKADMHNKTNTHTHNRFTALLDFVRDYLGEQVPKR